MLEKRVSTDFLKCGMYISRLDRPWVESPFMFQGFYLKTQQHIDEVSKYCDYVYIDVERGAEADQYLEALPTDAENQIDDFEKSLPIAKEKYTKLISEFTRVMENIRNGSPLDIKIIESQVNSIVEGVISNSDTYLLLSKLKNKDNYTYHHCVSCSILAISLGKELGLSKQELEELAIGTLLFDIGKMKLPANILNNPEKLKEDEFQLLRNHVNESVNILNKTKGIRKSTIQIAKDHHERFDGNGYPSGKRGREISLFASIAGLVDSYDAMTSQRPFSEPVKHETAVNELYAGKNKEFSEDLIEQFIQCLGTYPAGTLVELTTGEVGVVVQQNRIRRLQPKIMLLLNSNKESSGYFPVINLLSGPEDKAGNPIAIKKTLQPYAYGIDPEVFYL